MLPKTCKSLHLKDCTQVRCIVLLYGEKYPLSKSKILILTQKERVAIRSWKTPHLPLPLPIVNTNFLLKAKCWFWGGVGVKVFSQNLILIQKV